MANYDGDIKLSMSLDPNDVKQASKSLQDDIQKIFQQSAGKELDTKFKKIEASMSKASSKAQLLREKLVELESTKIPTQEYKEIQDQIDKATAALDKLRERQEKFLETGGKTKSNVFKKMQYDAAQLENTIEYAKGELQDLVDTGKAFTLGSDTGEYGKTVDQLANVNNEMRILTSRASDASRTVSNGSKVFKIFTNACKKLPSILKNISKSSTSADKSMKKMFWNIMKYGLGIRSLYVLFRKLRTAITEGVNNLVQTKGGMNETNQAISGLMSSLNALKNAWGAAFAPIIQVVAPMLTRLVDMLTQVMGKVSQFVAGITGKATAIVAKKQGFNYAESLDKSGTASGRNQQEKYDEAVRKAQEKYDKKVAETAKKNAEALAKAEEKQAKAAEKLAKKQEKANKQLGDYDKLNVIAQDSTEELEDITAKEYEQPELELPDLDDYMQGMTDFDSMFEEIPIESTISDFIQRIKDAWAAGDFTEIGNEVGEKLKEVTDNLTSWLVDVAQPLAEKLGKSLGTFINGLTQTEGLADSLGTAVGEGLNTIVDAINGFFDSVNWVQLGEFLAEGLNGLVNSIDWEELGHMLIMKWNALFETLLGFVDTFDFKKLGDGIAKGFTKIIEDFDMAALTGSISGLAAGLLETISGFLQGVNWYKMGHTLFEKIKDAIVGIEWGRLFTAIFEVLGSALGAFWSLLGGLIIAITKLVLKAWDEFVKWFESIAYEDGKFVIEGLLQGIWEVIKNIGKWIYDHILKPFVDGFKKAFGIASPSKVMIELAKLLMDGLKKGITDKINAVITAFNTIKTKIVAAFNSIKTTVLNIWNGLWTSVKNIISRAWSGIKSVINSILGGVEKMANGIVKGLNKAIDAINTLSFDVPDWVPKIGGNSIGFNIPNLSEISIPKLATGAVIPPNKQFLAMLGDQKSGTNIEAPLDTLIEAFNAVLDQRTENSNKEPIVLQLDGRTVAEVVWDEEDKRYKQRGSYKPKFT